jgi:3-hydroxyisobutyrate dehydrogenase-like beta-hydroxyacid dehydrogenase
MPRKSRKNVGLIGLGIIGVQVATGLRAAGFQVFVWNRSAKPAPNFLGSPVEVAEACEIIQIFVADGPALFDVIEAMADALTPKHIVICSATVGPEAVLEAAKMVMDRGARFLDAPFTGSKTAAEKRQLVYYIGGDNATYLRAKPMLEATSKTIVQIGGIGHASTVKVVTNMISAVTTQTLAEALAIVQGAGLDPEVLGLAIEHNACRSGVIEAKLLKMVAGDYEPHFSLKHMFKDVQLGIHLANGLDIEIPATTVTAGVLYGAINQGWADLDFSALYKIYAPHGHPGALSLYEREHEPALPDSEPKAISGDVPENNAPAPASVSAQMPQPAGELASASPPAIEHEPAPSQEKSPDSDLSDKDEAALILEAVIAEFRDIPPAGKEMTPASFAKEETPGAPVAGIPPANGEDAPNSPKPAARRVNFVRRWFVSRNRGS